MNHQASYWTVGYLLDDFLPRRQSDKAAKPDGPPCYLTAEFDPQAGLPVPLHPQRRRRRHDDRRVSLDAGGGRFAVRRAGSVSDRS